jgi:hypothetical protein
MGDHREIIGRSSGDHRERRCGFVDLRRGLKEWGEALG